MPKFTKLVRVGTKNKNKNPICLTPESKVTLPTLLLPLTSCLEYLITPSLRFLICEMGIPPITISKDQCKGKTKEGM